MNFSADAPSGEEHWTFALIAHRQAGDRDLSGLREQLALAASMGPRFIVLLSDVSTTVDGRFMAGQQRFEFGPDTIPVPLFLFGSDAEPARIDCAPFGCLRFVTASRLIGAAAARESGAADLGSLLSFGAESVPHTVLLLDRPLWTVAAPAVWQRVETELRRAAGDLFVLCAGSARFSWWQAAGITYFETAPACWSQHERVSPDGLTPGVVWCHFSAAGLKATVLSGAGAVRADHFSREVQRDRDLVRRSVSSSAVLPGESVTRVTCENPTRRKLVYEAAWQFSNEEVRVDPQILGFSLGPGEEFLQEFRFIHPATASLKLAQPVFQLRVTDAAHSHGPQFPIEMVATPWCTMSGRLAELSEAPVLDGRPGEWSSHGHELAHVAQVVRGKSAWSGPDDLSARLFVGVHDDVLHLAVTVHDDDVGTRRERGTDARVCLFLDRRSQEDRAAAGYAFRAPGELITIDVLADGAHAVTGVEQQESGIRVTTQLKQDGCSVEAAVPLALVPGVAADGCVAVDVAVWDEDASQLVEKTLFFSGGPINRQNSRHFALFSTPAPPPEPAPPQPAQ